MLNKSYSGDYYDSRSFLRDTNFKNFYLDVANLPKIKKSKGEIVVVPTECEHRIDLFSFQQYGTSRLWWVIALANADIIRDPIWNFKSGLSLFVPRDASILEKLSGVR